MHKEEYDAIAKARERNMPASIAVSYDLKSKMHHTEQMMDDITTKTKKSSKSASSFTPMAIPMRS